MDFEDHEEQEDEMGLTVGSTYESPSGNPSRGGPSGGVPGKVGAGGCEPGTVVAAAPMAAAHGGGNWKAAGRYRECLKNHAVSIGGHAVDGCGEFMAAGEEGTLDALKCAACNCHRNFHRKETEGVGGAMMGLEGPAGFHHQFSPYYRIPAGYLQQHHHHHAASAAHIRPAPLPLALPSTSGAQSREEQEDVSNPMMEREGKKRFRTKFTQEQKDKMMAFAEKLGWRIQKHDEAAVLEFCSENCVKRHVLKVWMHNNKHTLGKKP